MFGQHVCESFITKNETIKMKWNVFVLDIVRGMSLQTFFPLSTINVFFCTVERTIKVISLFIMLLLLEQEVSNERDTFWSSHTCLVVTRVGFERCQVEWMSAGRKTAGKQLDSEDFKKYFKGENLAIPRKNSEVLKNSIFQSKKSLFWFWNFTNYQRLLSEEDCSVLHFTKTRHNKLSNWDVSNYCNLWNHR